MRGHRVDDPEQPPHVLVEVGIADELLELPHAGDHPQHLADRPEAARLLEHLLEVFERELPRPEPLLLADHLVLVELPLRLFDERDDIPHPQDPPRHPLGVEILEGLDLLAGADELDRHAGDALHGERGAAAGIAVELRHDHAVELEGVIEGLGAADGVLAGHRVDDEVDLIGADGVVDALELVHERLVDCQSSRGVEDDDARPLLPRPVHAEPADGDRIGDPVGGVHRHAELSAEDDQLLDGGRTLEVGRDEHHAASLLLEAPGELGAGGRLAGALQAAEHDHRRPPRLEVERVIDRPHEVDQFLVDNAHELLARVERLEDLRPDRPLHDLVEEGVDDVIGDVGLEERRAHRAEPLAHVRLGQLAPAPQGGEGTGQRGRERFEHDGSRVGWEPGL